MAQDFVIGQITTRITDPKPSLEFYQKVLRMKLMSVQPVTPYRFTLYFLAYTEEDPPNADVEAVENREWLWQRPYTTLELQHRLEWWNNASGWLGYLYHSGPFTTDFFPHWLVKWSWNPGLRGLLIVRWDSAPASLSIPQLGLVSVVVFWLVRGTSGPQTTKQGCSATNV